MSDNHARPPHHQQTRLMDRGLRVGSLFGIEVRLDSSLIIVFMLLVYILGFSILPGWHPDWPAATTWFTAVAAGVLFFASVLVHELAHSLMSRRFGIEVRRITLFLFGGLAEIEEEPGDPRAEFLIAIVGPLTSLVLGLLCTQLGTSLAGAGVEELFARDPQAAMTDVSPLATVLLWLGPINVVLAIFNMVPGFPLDGGRVLRALLWWVTGDLYRATRVASEVGRLFGWFLMIMGGMQAIAGMLLQGVWLLFIGWFLANAASASYKQLVLRDLFKGVTARDMMRTHFETVTAQLRVADFIDQYLLQSAQLLWPVVEDGALIGLVTLQQVQAVPASERANIPIGQVMRTDLHALTLRPDTDANRTLVELGTHSSPLAVVEGSRVLGLLSQADAMKWLALHEV